MTIPAELPADDAEETGPVREVDRGARTEVDLPAVGPAAHDDDDEEAPVVLDPSDEVSRLEGDDGDDEDGGRELEQAYECLEIRTPIEEFETYARARVDTLVRLNQAERADRAQRALELGVETLRQVMGSAPREAR